MSCSLPKAMGYTPQFRPKFSRHCFSMQVRPEAKGKAQVCQTCGDSTQSLAEVANSVSPRGCRQGKVHTCLLREGG